MGRVWRAADEMLDRQVAVKEMRIDGLDAEDTRTRRERTLREARATARIDHPNVVRVYDVVDEGERLWIVMELVKGRSLERMTVEDGPLGPRDTALLGLGLVRALRQVHERGVLHRDIKPGNVLVESGDGAGRRIVLTDFGIAAMQDAKALTMVGMLVGSPDYMAPERVSGRPQGPPSDIWSLGATLCAALGGRSPFSRDTTLATLHAVLYEEPEIPAAAGPLTDILTALLEKDPSIRPSLDEAESALHTVALPTATPTLRMEAREEAGAGGDAGEAGDEGEVEERGAGAGAAQAAESEQAPGLPTGSTDRSDAGQGSSDPTPADQDTRVVRALRDPRVPVPVLVPEPEPEPETEAAEAEGAVPGPAESPPVAEDPEPSDAVPPGHEASGAGVAGGPGSAVDGSRAVAEAAEPSDAVPPGNEPRSVAQKPEPSDVVPSERTAAHVAESGDPAPAAADAVVAARSEPGVPAESFEPSADHRASASTEAVSEERSEVRSETPPGNSGGAVLRAGATTTSTPLASAPTQDSLAAGVPTEHFPMPDAPTRDTPTRAASAPTRVGPVPPTHRQPQHPGSGGDEPAPDPRTDPGTPAPPRPGRDAEDPALILGPHPHRIPPGELPGPARPVTPRRGRRRTALVAAGSMVAAGAVVVAIILATTSGSPGDDKAGSSTSASGSASSSAPGASTSAGTPSSTVEGTARPRSIPPGAHEEAGGFAWKTPTGWRRDVKTGAEVHYTSPDARQELAAKSSLARGDLMETWRTSEQNAHQGQDYRKIRLEDTTFRDHPAVVWEYTFTLGGVPWHAQLLGFNVGDKSYQINTWYQPDIETQALKTYEKVKESFTVL
ncbi:protein kinase [Streptomyces canus]|uniref:serine/threonine-protein kinase n=1 Tax=Streptomyces canus TaxID=58343 RepID=UPI0036B8A2ED